MKAVTRNGHNQGKTQEFRLAPLARALALTLLASGTAASVHAAPAAFSSGWFAAKGANQSQARSNGVAPASLLPTGAQQNQQAQQKLAQSINNLARVASGIAAQQAMQNAQRLIAMGQATDVQDGLAANGLSVDKDNAWINAQLGRDANDPSKAQTVDPSTGHVTVTVQQNAPRAIANWSSFNVGKNTTLYFDQSAGTQTNGANNWAILNRINDPKGKPSQILGQIVAEGSVYVINRNGIIFGGASQVNVHSLLASSLDFLNTNDHLVQTPADIKISNDLFLGQGANGPGGLAGLLAGTSDPLASGTGVPSEVLGLGNHVSIDSASDYVAPGDVTIAPGALISTQTTGTVSDGGFVLIAAPHVSNGGVIIANGGQVVLAGGVGVALRTNPKNPQTMLVQLTGQLTVEDSRGLDVSVTPVGSLVNDGMVLAERGNVTLLGTNVTQNGVAGVTTSVNTPGSITISTVDEYTSNTPMGTAYPNEPIVDTNSNGSLNITHRAGALIFGDGSITTILPDADGQQATSAPGVTFTPGSISVTAGSAWLRSGSLIEAPGADVSIAVLNPSAALDTTPPGNTSVQGRLLVDTGATVDVAGLADVELAASDSIVKIDRIGQNELADSPLQRNSFLFTLTDVMIDSTLRGTRADGTPWVGSPVLNAQGYVDLIPRSIDQFMTHGGTITLVGDQVMTAQGSTLNVSGGYTHYLAGQVATTRVIDAYGRILPIGQVDPNVPIVGIAGQYVDNHDRWGVSTTWSNPLMSRPVYQDEFVVGDGAGTITVSGSSAMVLDGAMSAQVVAGTKQILNASQPLGGAFIVGKGITLAEGNNTSTTGVKGLVIIQDRAPDLDSLAADFSIDTPLDKAALNALDDTDPNNIFATQVIPADTLSEGGFASVSITGNRNSYVGVKVAEGTQLDLQPGGSFTVSAPIGNKPQDSGTLEVLGSINMPSGTFSFKGGGDIVVGPNGSINVAGQWVNNDPRTAPDSTPGGSQFIDGGSISLLTASDRIDLQPGSVLDASGGGEMQANGQLLMRNGLPAGKGGDVALIADNAIIDYPAELLANNVHMDGTIRGFGFEGGGTLSIQTSGFQLGGDPATAPAESMVLPVDFFARQGFGNYELNALYDITVPEDVTLRLTQQDLIPNVPALMQAASGANLQQGGLTTVGTVDPYYRQATGLVLVAGGYVAGGPNYSSANAGVPPHPIPQSYQGVGTVLISQGAAIIGDAGAHIGLGSPVQVTVLGSIIAPGGAITLTADTLPGSYALPGQFTNSITPFTGAGKSVWLGSDAVLDVSGVALADPFPQPVRSGTETFIPDTGKVLPGGSVVLSDDTGYIIAQAGAVIDVSGAAANFDQLQADGRYASQPVWSDAGSITLAPTSGLYFDGTLRAQGGAQQAQGGTLNILPNADAQDHTFQIGGAGPKLPGATALIITQSGDTVPAGLQPGQSLPDGGTPSGVALFAADRLTDSGIGTLVLGNSGLMAGKTVPIAFHGSVDIGATRAVIVNANTIAALSDQQMAELLPSVNPDTTATNKWLPAQTTLSALLADEAAHLDVSDLPNVGTAVRIDAPYIAFVGPTGAANAAVQVTPVAALADGTLTLNASFIDLVNQFQLNNFGQATFNSSGDIRLSSTAQTQASSATNALNPGLLYTPGNLTFAAADVYPSTGTPFILAAVGPKGADGSPVATTITFQANGSSSTPLSAGGALMVDATNIVQAGTVRAPSGSLIFGVGDPNDPATKAQFNSLPLVATESVTLAPGSVTSVSNDGLIIPYGTTVDGLEWQFNPVPGAAPAPDLASAPSKTISINGSSVALSPGASIDLSGGGNLQAMEWVPGTGGSRDVLSQYNVSYASSQGGTAVPVNVGATNVYAILPGPQSPVAAYDPVMAQTVQPTTSQNGSTGTTTAGIGVGMPSLDGSVGQSVYLQGVAGLPDGVYTLLPGRYATLPGAYRVTVNSTGTAMPGAHATAPDGTQIVTGYWSDALSGARSATPTLFNVQSGATWQQYSQYTLTSADSFFSMQAAKNGNVVPALSRDAGQLVLAASQALSLGATLNTAAADGGAPAQVDIASQDIQIVGQGEAALSGYLQISASDLDALGAGSLLIGGKRTLTADGFSIEALANSVVVSNDAAHPLTGPEIILVTRTVGDAGASGSTGGNTANATTTNGTNSGTAGGAATDPNAANGLRIDSGSVITATGAYPTSKDVPITIGHAPDDSGQGGISGDGALLMVSNGAPVTVTRVNTTAAADNDGLLTVAAGANLSGGQSLILDSSGDVRFDPAASLSGKTIAVDGSRITFTDKTGADAAAIPGFVVGAAQIAQLAQADTVVLRSYGSMLFDGNVNARFGNDVDLSAGVFEGTGGNVVIEAPRVAFTNEAGATIPDTMTTGAGSLTVKATELDLGAGDKAVSGFGAVALSATSAIVGQNTGTFNFGALPVTITAPVYLADTGSDATVKTTGMLNINPGAGTALDRAAAGGALTFVGGTVNDNGATILAPGGNVVMEASDGDLNIAPGSLISAAGIAKNFFDILAYAPAGTISLASDTGTVNVASGATLDFSGAQGGGKAGTLKLSAPEQTVQLAGTIKGGAAAGYQGGSFSLNTGGAADLDSLAALLATSGVNNAITIRTGAGNLTLSAGHTIVAHNVSLTADGGAGGTDTANGYIAIQGTINASGAAGGEIDLYGKSGVELDGSLIARACLGGVSCDNDHLNPNQRGGTVNIGTTAVGNTADINATYGYENVSSAQSGWITLGANSLIDVSGGSAGGLSGGTVNFRAPLVDTATGPGSVNLRADGSARIVGSRATTVEAYAVWSTDDQGSGNKHFDSIVDPAGWFDPQGHLLGGTFTSQDGNTVFNFTPDGTGGGTVTNTSTNVTTTVTADQLRNGDAAIDFGGLTSDTFAATSPNADHQQFYGYLDPANKTAGTLIAFVQNGVQGAATALANTPFARFDNFAVVPGIELSNPDKTINNGNISILSNWNLGAEGATANSLSFRFNGLAPILTLRAENNVDTEASLTDGFFQIVNPVAPPAQTVDAPPLVGYDYVLNSWNEPSGAYIDIGAGLYYYATLPVGHGFEVAEAPVDIGDTQADQQYYALYQAYVNTLLNPLPGLGAGNTGSGIATNAYWTWQSIKAGGPNDIWGSNPGQPAAPPTAPTSLEQLNDPTKYLSYLAAYNAYVAQLFAAAAKAGQETAHYKQPILSPLVPPADQALPLIPPGTKIVVSPPPPMDNTPAPVANALNPTPLLAATLTGGSSTSYRIVSGADSGSANPLALQAATLFANGGGGMTLGGHTSFVDDNGGTIVTPTMIRTGTGSIAIAAAGDIGMTDTTAPAVIYAGGAPAAGVSQGSTVTIVNGTRSQGIPDALVTPVVNPDSAGDISIQAQGDIIGVGNVIDADGAITNRPGTNIGQLWQSWLLTGNLAGSVGGKTQTVQTSINFGGFDQGVMSVGGNVDVTAGGNVENLGVSLPTTWYLTGANTGSPVVNVVGGGNLTVNATGDILGGNYFVARGTGTLTSGGKIGPDAGLHTTYNPNSINHIVSIGQVSTVLAAQDGAFDVTARQGVDIGSVINPSYLSNTAVQAYSATSAVDVVSTTGDIVFGSLGGTAQSTLFGNNSTPPVLPATIDMTAFTGDIAIQASGELAPSPVGTLNLLADQTITFSSKNGVAVAKNGASGGVPVFGMLDVDPSAMPTSLNPDAAVAQAGTTGSTAHALTALHADDTEPVRIYSLNGDIVDGLLQPQGQGGDSGFYSQLVSVVVDKPALVQAGQDIVNLIFIGQNLRQSDVTRIVAGNDIYDTPLPRQTTPLPPRLELGGPGVFDIQAGHNIGPLTNELQMFNVSGSNVLGAPTPGILAVGNADNPNLPHESASINVLYGVGPGVNLADFIAHYVDPSSAGVGDIAPATDALLAFVKNYDAGQMVDTGLIKDKDAAQAKPGIKDMTVDQAWAQFQTLPPYVQQMFAEQTLFAILTKVGKDFHDPDSPDAGKYERGYAAINALFPGSLGYTANNLEGGSNGANQLNTTGDLDIRSTTIQTQQGGNINIIGPGGQALVGSTSAPPAIVSGGVVLAGPGTQGILTLEQGDINIFTDRSVLLAQSRIFTEQGGAMTIWSSNGDINAGKGAKSAADLPLPLYVCDFNHYCTVDARGEVSGAGIATLQTIPGAPASDANLIAPRGTVDAGDAGIRVSGNLNIAALHVANADNIQVQGKSTGIPIVATVNVSALTSASAAATAAADAAENLGRQQQAAARQALPSIITVQVLGFGSDPVNGPAPAGKGSDRSPSGGASLNMGGPLRILGVNKDVDPRQLARLDAEEREHVLHDQ